jgi:hypothetical protein
VVLPYSALHTALPWRLVAQNTCGTATTDAMRLHINKILILGFLGYIAYEVHHMYKFCQPPHLPAGSEDAVEWDLQKVGPLDIHILLSMKDKMPKMASGPDKKVDPQDGKEWTFEEMKQAYKSQKNDAELQKYWDACTPVKPGYMPPHLLVGEFKAVQPSEDVSLPDLTIRNLSLPAKFYSNGTVYLHVLAVSEQGGILRHSVEKISRHVLQAGRREPTRYLLSETELRGLPPAKPVASLPRVIELGFVQETQPLNATVLMEKGLQQFVQDNQLKLPLFVNTLISPRDEYIPLLREGDEQSIDGIVELPAFDIRFRNIGVGYWTMQMQISVSFDEAEKMMSLNEYDVDSFKQMIGGSSPTKILVVYGIAILHLVFSWLAFANDISFWRQKTSFEGFSANSVTMQACINIISFLYVKEAKQTKFVMYFIGFRFLLQLWKLRKLTEFKRAATFPFVRWVNRAGTSTGLEELEEIADDERRCMKYLGLVLFPLIIAFSAYRLVYQRFRSWYSWAVLTLNICAQAGGFVVMTPQVFMNHRLKSVEHLPWKVLTYQAINTFIDDIFALCIRMPEVQKYSVFRDDIVFLICCFQRWLYKKPKTIADAPSDKPKDE